MKLLSLFEATKKRKFRADDHFRLYMPNGGEDGVLIGWRADWPDNHYIEFRGPPYSQWKGEGSDFERVHDRLAGMRATVLHHNSVVDIIPGMEEHDDIARAINGGPVPEWDADRAFNESAGDVLYHATLRDNEQDILQVGINPSVGPVVKQKHDADIPLVYAAHGTGGREKLLSVLAMHISKKLGKGFYDVTRDEIIKYGTIGVIKSDANKLQKSKGLGKPHVGLEPRDYYSDETVRVDHFMTPEEMQKFLGRQLLKVNEGVSVATSILYDGEQKYAVKPERGSPYVLMTIPTAAIERGWIDDKDFYIGRGGSGASIGKRYEGFQEWLKQHDQYEVPSIHVDEQGKVGFSDGRHRYAVLRDAGIDPMPVAIGLHGAKNAMRFMNGQIRESITEMAEEWDAEVLGDKTLESLAEDTDRDNAARLARAQAMGFDTSKVWYHGTNRSFDAFSKDVDPVFDNAQQHLGYFFTGNAKYAGGYTMGNDPEMTEYGGGNLVPVFLRAKKLKAEDIDVMNAIEGNEYGGWEPEEVEEYKSDLIRQGYDGINFGNGYEVVIFDERNIRSIHAQFNDPNSDKLLASKGEITEMADPNVIRAAAPKALAKLKAELASGIDDAHEEFSYATNTEFDDPKFDEKFALWKEGYAQKRIGMAIKILQKAVEYRDGKMLVHRMIMADEDWLTRITERGLGQYWTWDKEYAEAYAGQGSNEWLISGLIDPASVDWVSTILANAHPATGQEEKEITIPEGTPVKVVGIEVDGEPVDPSRYERGRVMMASIGEDRQQRARDMGFDTDKVWYHANTGGIEGEGFDNERLPEHDPDRPFNAHWFSSEPSEFAAYPSTGNTITPVHLRLDPNKEATHDVWRKVARNVHMMFRRGEAPKGKGAADLIREILVDKGYTHAVRGREPIDAEELKRTGQTQHKTSTGGTITLKWEKMKTMPRPPEYTPEEYDLITKYEDAKRQFDNFHSLIVGMVMDNEMTPEQTEQLKAKGIELKNDIDKLEPLVNAANDRAYAVVDAQREEIDTLEMYDDDIGHVTGYSSLEDYEESHPEQEDIAVLDPSIIRSVHADFDPEHAGKNKIMARKGS